MPALLQRTPSIGSIPGFITMLIGVGLSIVVLSMIPWVRQRLGLQPTTLFNG
jgi:hypothetical protein